MSLHVPQINLAPILAVAEDANHQTDSERITNVEGRDKRMQDLQLVADLQREAEERKDAELGVAAFKRQLTTLRERCTALDSQIEHYRAVAGNLGREKMAGNGKKLGVQGRSGRFSKEQRLGYPSDPEREYTLVLDRRRRFEYKVSTCLIRPHRLGPSLWFRKQSM
ncbi:hypothetical protein B0H14DRAFT_3155453 [Mycena olivaceomarginata]|nr:hypothetical protein B0H14DRAFT_3155453 [Mycena olivaceomarginata]